MGNLQSVSLLCYYCKHKSATFFSLLIDLNSGLNKYDELALFGWRSHLAFLSIVFSPQVLNISALRTDKARILDAKVMPQ